MKLFYTDIFVLPLPPGHHFPMEKYCRLRDRIVQKGLVNADSLCVPLAATDAEITRAHDPAYLRRIVAGAQSPQEIRRMGLPWTEQLVERARRSSGATIAACRSALSDGIGINLAGGTHHAFHDRAEGYCVFNDSAVAARAVLAEQHARRILIVDCDVHQGNGTAAILAADAAIFTFSMHGRKNFPHDKETSDLDIALEDGTEDAEYLDCLARGLATAIDRARPDLAVYLAGADPFYDDKFGRLALTMDGLLERDRYVLDTCSRAGIPVAVTMAGGYARQVGDTVEIHCNTVKAAVDLCSNKIESEL
ncbi:MAG: histone deacetylase [Deltaproteobacteria bacterium]|nr:histone deacetylase [Deltaproteobacteria bacterium]